MSKFKINKSVLAAAMAVVLIPGLASAAVVTVGGSNKHAFEVTNQTGGDNVTAIANSSIAYTLLAGDILIGRTLASGNVNIRINLTSASFAAVPNITVPTTQGLLIGTPVISAGTLSFVIEPIATGMVAGDLFTIAAGQFSLKNATALTTLGGNVIASIDARDVTSGLVLQEAVPGTILTSVQASAVAIAAGNTVTSNVLAGKKTFLGGTGVVDGTNVELGTITANPVFTAAASVRGAGAIFAHNTDGTHNFQFDVNGGASIEAANRDRLAVEVNLTDTTGFTSVYLSSGTCSTGALANSAGTMALLSKTGNQYAGSIDLNAAGSANAFKVCGRVDGTNEIKAQAITARAKIDYLVARDTEFTAASTITNIVYNGVVVDVMHFNPASNVSQASFLRISNTSVTGGQITIDGVCDNGVASTTPVRFNLDARKSILLTSTEVQNGNVVKGLSNGLGACPAGKYRLTVTGEVGTMEVQNFLRNDTSAGTVNANVNNKN